jgi:hypothetical protein
MFGRAGRRFLSLHSSRRLTALLAAIVVLGAVCVSAAQTPTASAQGWPWWGNNWLGYNSSYLGYGLGYGGYYGAFGNPLTNVYGYGLNTMPYNLYGGGYLPGVVYANVVTSSSAQPSATSMSVDIYQPVTGPVAIGYGVPHTYAVSGEYCTDKSGGKVWVVAGAPTDGLTC